MAFQLRAKEPVREGIARNVRSQIEKALGYLTTLHTRKQPVRDGAENEAVHEVRKCFKRVRAALRLVREDLGDDFYREENWAFRDAARPLTQLRDADVLIQTADHLAKQFPEAVEPGAFAKIHEALLQNRQEVTRRVLIGSRAATVAEQAAHRGVARLPNWRIGRDGWDALESGLRHVYRTGHHALTLAMESPSVENLHEVRKQAKYLWHQLQLLEGAWTGGGKELIEQAHKLSTLLGEDHDLAVLRQTLAADPLAYGGHRVLKDLFAVIDRRRVELEDQAFVLASEVYREAPRAFTSRIEASVNYGRSHEERQPIQKLAAGIGPGSAVEAGHRQSQAANSRKR